MQLFVVDGPLLAERAGAWVAEQLRTIVRERQRASIALSGGNTPRAMHTALAGEKALPWKCIDVYWGDERCVPPEHPDSNYRMAKESLLERVPIPPENVYRPRAESPDHDGAAREYEALLPRALDLVVLGIGEDGHTASLFPGNPALDESERRCVAVVGPKPPPDRLTLTPGALASARTLVTLVSGRGKADAVARALEGEWNPNATPAQLARRGVWFVDRDAAVSLSSAAGSRGAS